VATSRKTLRCRVVTPGKQLLDEPITHASVPMWDGLMGVLPDRQPIVGQLGLGELIVDFPDSTHPEGGKRSFFIDAGFVRKGADELTIIAERATPIEEISVQEAETELAEAQARQIPADSPNRLADARRVARDRERARAKLRIARSVRATGI